MPNRIGSFVIVIIDWGRTPVFILICPCFLLDHPP